MSNVLLERRREMSAKKAENPYAGFSFGRIYNGVIYRWGDMTDAGTQGIPKVSPEFPVVGGHVIVYNYHPNGTLPKDVRGTDFGEQSMKGILANGGSETSSGKNGYLGSRCSTPKNTATLSASVVSIIVSTTYSLDDFFLYDRTAGEYIYRGKNVTANSQ